MPAKPYDSSTCLFESCDGDVESVLVALGSLALMYQRLDVRAHTFGVEPIGAQETVDLVLQSRGLNANRSNPIMLASSSSMRDWSCFSVDGAWGLWAGLDAGLGAAGAWVVVDLRGAWGLATLCIRKSEAKRSRLTKVSLLGNDWRHGFHHRLDGRVDRLRLLGCMLGSWLRVK